jgi:hypothetical protein
MEKQKQKLRERERADGYRLTLEAQRNRILFRVGMGRTLCRERELLCPFAKLNHDLL